MLFSSLFGFFDEGDFVVGQFIELVDEVANLIISGPIVSEPNAFYLGF
jgi:hypothetical protein